MPDTPRYRVLHSLGKGGMGEVFLADDTQLGRKVAIKFLVDGATNDSRALERLHREARSAAALDHPYICKIHEITEVDGRTGIVMEHVSGETLQAELARTPLSPKRALEIAGEVAEALEESHRKRVVHRDLKPANVMLTKQGHVKVMDFGLAKQVGVGSSDEQTTGSLTDPGTRVGTPAYMAPEQLLGSDADERSDIFAFGILLYELLAGMHPFKRSSPSGTMAAILREPPAPIVQYAKDAPETARATLDRLLTKEPSERYQSFQDVRSALDELGSASGSAIRSTLDEATPQPELPPNNLPSAVDSFVGRTDELAEVEEALVDTRLVTLTGVGGTGKTRLAVEVATHLLPRFADGAWLAELAPVTQEEGVPHAVADVVGAMQLPDKTITDSLVAALKHRSALLVLDNCEHVLDAAAELAEAITTQCPEIRILATSREEDWLFGASASCGSPRWATRTAPSCFEIGHGRQRPSVR